MTQSDALRALWEVNQDEQRAATAADVAALEEEDAKEAARTLLRAYRNGRCRRAWWTNGLPGGGHYVYVITPRGEGYVERQLEAEQDDEVDGQQPATAWAW